MNWVEQFIRNWYTQKTENREQFTPSDIELYNCAKNNNILKDLVREDGTSR